MVCINYAFSKNSNFNITIFSEGCCSFLPESINSVLSSMMDTSLLKDPVFMTIGISNVFGMAGLYVPFVYLVDFAKVSFDMSLK